MRCKAALTVFCPGSAEQTSRGALSGEAVQVGQFAAVEEHSPASDSDGACCHVLLAGTGEAGQQRVAAAMLHLLQDCGRVHVLALPAMLLAGHIPPPPARLPARPPSLRTLRICRSHRGAIPVDATEVAACPPDMPVPPDNARSAAAKHRSSVRKGQQANVQSTCMSPFGLRWTKKQRSCA